MAYLSRSEMVEELELHLGHRMMAPESIHEEDLRALVEVISKPYECDCADEIEELEARIEELMEENAELKEGRREKINQQDLDTMRQAVEVQTIDLAKFKTWG